MNTYSDCLKEWGIEAIKNKNYPFLCYKSKWDSNMVLSSINTSSIKDRIGRLLFNAKEKIVCFGLADGSEKNSMIAKTETDKGVFWNGELFIIVIPPGEEDY